MNNDLSTVFDMKPIHKKIDSKNTMDVLIVGDVHGQFYDFSQLIKKENPDLVIQVGDFGYWPNAKNLKIEIDNGNIPVYFIDGNHEDFFSLGKLTGDMEVAPNVYYVPRGSTMTIRSKVFSFMGGAESIDKNMRTIGFDWFPEESISLRDMYKIRKIDVDYMITHTCPVEFVHWNYSQEWEYTSGRQLSTLLEWKPPLNWFFGHFHFYKQGYHESTGTTWTCLDMIGNTDINFKKITL